MRLSASVITIFNTHPLECCYCGFVYVCAHCFNWERVGGEGLAERELMEGRD